MLPHSSCDRLWFFWIGNQDICTAQQSYGITVDDIKNVPSCSRHLDNKSLAMTQGVRIRHLGLVLWNVLAYRINACDRY